MAFPTVKVPHLSPSLNEYDLPTELDPTSGYNIPLMGVVQPDVNGNTTLSTGVGVVVQPPASQVSGNRQLPQVGTSKIPVIGLVNLDPTTGAPLPFKAGNSLLADSATVAASVSGKFQSTVLTGTGSAQSIAHGLVTVPSLVLVSIYDTNGVALPFVISEGTHTITNIVVTVTASVKYKVIAFK